jgi:hypothetical protein
MYQSPWTRDPRLDGLRLKGQAGVEGTQCRGCTLKRLSYRSRCLIWFNLGSGLLVFL